MGLPTATADAHPGLHAATKKDTVNGALRDVARRDAATRFLNHACAGIFTAATHPDRQSNPAGTPTDVEYLVDASAILHLPRPDVAAVLGPLIQAGAAATCAVIDLALLALITDPAQFTEIRDLLARSFVFLTTTDDDLHRAVDVRTEWVNGGRSHRQSHQPVHRLGHPRRPTRPRCSVSSSRT